MLVMDKTGTKKKGVRRRKNKLPFPSSTIRRQRFTERDNKTQESPRVEGEPNYL